MEEWDGHFLDTIFVCIKIYIISLFKYIISFLNIKIKRNKTRHYTAIFTIKYYTT